MNGRTGFMDCPGNDCPGNGTELRLTVSRCLRTVSSSRDVGEVSDALRTLLRYLDDDCHGEAAVTGEFHRVYYTRVLQVLIGALSADWMSGLSDGQRKELWDKFFLLGPPDQAVLALVDAIRSSSPSAGLERMVYVLEQFVNKGRIADLLWTRCVDVGVRSESAHLRELVLARLVSLPDLVCNRLHTNTPAPLLPQQYYPLLATQILHTLQRTCQALRAGQDCCLGFVAQLLGKTCVQSHSELLFGVLAPQLSSLTHHDVLWQRVSSTLLENVPERWTEAVVRGLIQALDGAEALSRVMGNLVMKNKRAQFVVTHKLLLLQYSLQVQGLKTVLGYLALDPERRSLLKQVLRSVCKVWCNSSAVRHTPVEQQLYVSRSLLLCVSLLSQDDIQELRTELLQCMLGGVQCRLDSSTERVRKIGMVVGECLSQKLDTPTSQLKFQFEPDDDTLELRSLMEPPSAQHVPDPQHSQRTEPDSEGQRSAGQPVTSQSPSANQSSAPKGDSDSELDSDDELTPYDMSCDQEKPRVTPPRYVRDCLDVLLSSDDAERVRMSLQVAEELLRKNISATQEVSVQFSKVLLHLEDRYSTPAFHSLRQNTMVALTVTHTEPVVKYWTTEFYGLNYSLRQRMDILEVLALSAQELCEPIADKHSSFVEPITDKHSSSIQTLSMEPVTTPEQCSGPVHWRHVVEERIQSKTKRLSRGVSRAPPKTAPNRFAPVAGHFFFPLLRNYDRPQVTFDLLGSDHLVLGRLIHTLGLLMHLATNAPVAAQMGRALLDFVWVLRFHADQMVRRGVLFAVCAVFLSMPSNCLLLELSEDLTETRVWLAEVAESDPDADCRSLAVQSLRLLDQALKTELQLNTPEHT